MKNNLKEISVYIHLPFCERKCLYCAFTSFVSSEDMQKEYIKHLLKEIEKFENGYKAKTIYFGGGTPSVLRLDLLEKIFDALKTKFEIATDAEITMEVNPNSVDEEKLGFYKRLGVNRLSMGIQSLNDKTLKKLGRLHTKKEALYKLQLATKFFDNVSCDLILGLEKEKNVVKYARKLIKFGIKHISCYILEVHENTPLYSLVKNKKYQPLNDEAVAKSYEKLRKFLEKQGFNQYEISNFSLLGFESKHNLAYWSYDDYVGFGLSSHSFLDGARYENSSNLKAYYEGKGQSETITNDKEIEERILLGLRCKNGVDLEKLKKMGYFLEKNEFFMQFLEKNILKKVNNRIFLNPNYYAVSDFIIEHLLP